MLSLQNFRIRKLAFSEYFVQKKFTPTGSDTPVLGWEPCDKYHPGAREMKLENIEPQLRILPTPSKSDLFMAAYLSPGSLNVGDPKGVVQENYKFAENRSQKTLDFPSYDANFDPEQQAFRQQAKLKADTQQHGGTHKVSLLKTMRWENGRWVPVNESGHSIPSSVMECGLSPQQKSMLDAEIYCEKKKKKRIWSWVNECISFYSQTWWVLAVWNKSGL